MAKKASVVEETPLPTEEVAPSDATAPAVVEEAKPPEEGVTEPEPKEEKPDFAAQIAELPEDERKALLKEHLGEELNRLEQSARDTAWSKLQADQQRQIQANQALQATLSNLEVADDDNKRAGHIQAYADSYAQSASGRWAAEALDNLRESLCLLYTSPSPRD